MSCCNKKNVIGPSGIWDYYQLIGAKVHIKSVPIDNFFFCSQNSSDVYTIKNITFRISVDGKTITVIELEELEGKIFTWRDLEILSINYTRLYKPICGTFCSNQAICGSMVDTSPSYLDNNISNGVSIIDCNGNVNDGRYIKFIEIDSDDNKGGN